MCVAHSLKVMELNIFCLRLKVQHSICQIMTFITCKVFYVSDWSYNTVCQISSMDYPSPRIGRTMAGPAPPEFSLCLSPILLTSVLKIQNWDQSQDHQYAFFNYAWAQIVISKFKTVVILYINYAFYGKLEVIWTLFQYLLQLYSLMH